MTAPARLRPPPAPRGLRHLALLICAAVLAGCANAPLRPFARTELLPDLRGSLNANAPASAAAPAAQAAPPAKPSAAVDEVAATLPPARAERRFSVTLNNVAPDVIFMALLNETPLSVAVDPGVKGPLSVAFKNVTLREALDLMRELHSLEYKVIGRHILVSAAQMQTRIFTVDYPSFNRNGRSETRVLSGSITGSGGGSAGSSPSGAGTSGASTGGSSAAAESSRVSTSQRNDLWGDIEASVKLLVGEKDGRNVVVSPQTGSIVVRALPRELRLVADFLESSRVAVKRQVMLEAKIVEVQLRDSERTGVNWAAFKNGANTRASGGVLGSGSSLSPTGSLVGNLIGATPGSLLEAANSVNGGSPLGLAFQTSNFAAVLEFLDTQGSAQVLSSPRIATINNQKAVLKVGTDDFFVTNVSTTTTPVGNTSSTTPSITVQPFFSGISLDVTPNIDAQGYITLHIHPAVSVVSERIKVINLGSQGNYSLPLASSDINESDAVVRARDGQIIAIGGLMRQALSSGDSGVPGTEGPLRRLLGGQSNKLSEKRELVILLKPTVIDANLDDSEARRDVLQRLIDWTEVQTAARP